MPATITGSRLNLIVVSFALGTALLVLPAQGSYQSSIVDDSFNGNNVGADPPAILMMIGITVLVGTMLSLSWQLYGPLSSGQLAGLGLPPIVVGLTLFPALVVAGPGGPVRTTNALGTPLSPTTAINIALLLVPAAVLVMGITWLHLVKRNAFDAPIELSPYGDPEEYVEVRAPGPPLGPSLGWLALVGVGSALVLVAMTFEYEIDYDAVVVAESDLAGIWTALVGTGIFIIGVDGLLRKTTRMRGREGLLARLGVAISVILLITLVLPFPVHFFHESGIEWGDGLEGPRLEGRDDFLESYGEYPLGHDVKHEAMLGPLAALFFLVVAYVIGVPSLVRLLSASGADDSDYNPFSGSTE